MKSLRPLWVFLACSVTAFSTASQSMAVDLVDNTLDSTAALSVENAPLDGTRRGYAFTVGSSPISLDTVTFGLWALSSGTAPVSIQLYAGSGASGSPVQTSSPTTVNLGSVSPQYYNFNVSWTLNPNTTYSIMASYTTTGGAQPPYVAKTGSPLLTDSLVTGVGFFDGTTPTNVNYAVRFQGTVVPEPSTYVLGGIAMACVAAMASKRSLSRGIA